jgi:DNA-binding GntR family transcriptional regulator
LRSSSRGVVVATVDPAYLLAIHEVRMFLEAGAASLCAQRITAEGVRELRKILRARLHIEDTAARLRSATECLFRSDELQRGPGPLQSAGFPFARE